MLGIWTGPLSKLLHATHAICATHARQVHAAPFSVHARQIHTAPFPVHVRQAHTAGQMQVLHLCAKSSCACISKGTSSNKHDTYVSTVANMLIVLRHLQREHIDLLNSSDGHPAAAAAAAEKPPCSKAAAAALQQAGDPAAALQQMQSKLDALKIRKHRITGEYMHPDPQGLRHLKAVYGMCHIPVPAQPANSSQTSVTAQVCSCLSV